MAGRRAPLAPWVIYLAGVVPALWLAADLMQGRLGADPVREIEHRLGLTALRLLVAGLALTPLRRLAGINLLRYRRQVGLLAFGYAVLHLAVWLMLDLQLRWAEIGADLTKRPYVMLGMAALLLLLPLALTSHDGALRRLGGRRWRRLHRLVYPAVLLAALHHVWLQKTWATGPLLYLAAVVVLLGLRLPGLARWSPLRRRAG